MKKAWPFLSAIKSSGWFNNTILGIKLFELEINLIGHKSELNSLSITNNCITKLSNKIDKCGVS